MTYLIIDYYWSSSST